MLRAIPKTVAILGLGPSLEAYVDIAKRLGGRRKLVDETWGINAVIDIIACDRGFHMDDVRVQQARAVEAPESNIAAMLPWLRRHPGPIYTSRPHPEYPGLVAYPLQDVMNTCRGGPYFNSTAAYAVAYAIHTGVEEIQLYGCDFSYANSHQAEKGRACVEFWLGYAQARGIKVSLPQKTSLLDACYGREARLYGYDTLHVDFHVQDNGVLKLGFREREHLPSAAEIEAAYDHSAPIDKQHRMHGA